MPNPFEFASNPFASNPFSQPYSRLFAPRAQTARDLLPAFNPEEDQSTAGWLLEEGLGGLGYLGSVLDKSFGARGLRGLLGGRPEELLSILPLSDTFDITDQRNEVTGRDLLSDLGFTTRRQPNEPFNWEDDLLGIGAEVLLDPSTYLTFGLSSAGKAALKAGGRQALAKGFTNQLRAGQRGLNFHVPFGELLNPSTTKQWIKNYDGTFSKTVDAGGSLDDYLRDANYLTDQQKYDAWNELTRRRLDMQSDPTRNKWSVDQWNDTHSNVMDWINDGKPLNDFNLSIIGDMVPSWRPDRLEHIPGGIGADLIPGPQVADALGLMRAGATAPTMALDYGLDALTGYRPFQGTQRALYENVGEPMGRYLSRLFEPAVKSRGPYQAQEVARSASGLETKLEGESLEDYAQRTLDYLALGGKDATPEFRDNLLRSAMAKIEAGEQGTLLPKLQGEAKERAHDIMEKFISKADPDYKTNRANLTQWVRGVDELNPTMESLFNTQVPRHDQSLIKETLPTRETDLLQALPDRDRFLGQVREVWGEDAVKVTAFHDALAKWWAKKTGGTPNEYFRNLTNVKGGVPGSGALAQMEEGAVLSGDLFKGFAETNKRMPATAGEALEAMAASDNRLSTLAKKMLENSDEDARAARINWGDDFDTAAHHAYDHEIDLIPGKNSDVDVIHEITHGMTSRKMLRDMVNDFVAKNPEAAALMDSKDINLMVRDKYWQSTGADYIKSVRELAESPHVSEPVRNLNKAYLQAAESKDFLKKLEGYNQELSLTPGKEGGRTIKTFVEGVAGGDVKGTRVGLPYGMSNIAEFMAETMSNPAFQKMLKEIPVAGPQKNLLGRVIDSIKSMLGLKGADATLFDSVTKDIEKLSSMDYKLMHSDLAKQVKPGEYTLFQGQKGSFEVTKRGERIMRNLQGGDLSTFLHESGHDLTYMLSRVDPAQADELARASGAKNYASMTVDNHENIARGLEKYLRDGVAPIPALQRAFESIKEFLVDLYKTIVGTPLEGKLNTEMKAIFDDILKQGADVPLPKGTPDVALFNALEDMLNKGFLPEQLPGGGYRMNPGEGLLAEDRDFLRRTIRRDPVLGPKSLKDLVADPLQLDQKAYSRALGKFARDPNYDLEKLFTDPRFGDKAAAAMASLEDTAQYKRVMKLDKAIEFQPPKGAEDMAKWADQNLTPDQLTEFNRLVDRDRQVLAKFKEVEKTVGARGGNLMDSWVNYMSRQMSKYPANDPRAKTSKAADMYWRDLKASNEAFEKRKDIFRDVPGGTATINDLSMDKRLSGPARTMNPEEIRTEIREVLTGMKFPAKRSPAWKQAEGLEKWLGGLPADHAEKSIPYFSADLPNLMFQRRKGMNEVQVVGQAAETAISRFAKPAAEFAAEGKESMSLKEFLTRMNLDGADGGGSIWAQKILGAPTTKGELRTLDDIKDIHLAKDAAEDILKMNDVARTPDILKPVIEGYDAASRITKAYLTRPFVSFHTRNLLSGLFNTWRSTGGVGLDNFKGTVEFLTGKGDNLIPGVTRDQLWKELVAGRIAFTPNTSLSADILGAGGQIVEQGIRKPQDTGKGVLGRAGELAKQAVADVKAKPGEALNPLNSQNALLKGMTEAGQSIEDFTRVNHYVTLRKQGWEPAAAAEEVLKYQIDYRNLTQAEKSFFRRVFPWYGFCVPESYEILSRNGWKTHDQLVVGEDVLSLNHATGEMEWVPVEAINVFDHDGSMHSLEGRGCKWLSTENHRWPTHRRHTRKKLRRPEFVESWQLNDSDAIPRCGEYRGSDSILSPRLAAILGWVVTDGSFRCRQGGRYKGECWEMVVYQSEIKHIGKVEEALGNQRRDGADRRTVRTTSSVVANSPVHTVAVRREDIVAITKHFRTKADLPKIVGRLSREAAEAMFDAMMMAEGSMSATGQQQFKQSKKNVAVLEAFQILCYLTGRSANVSNDGCYVMRNKRLYPKKSQINTEHYSGKVWCPTTKHGTWVMRANGKAIITGNSRGTLPTILSDLVNKPSNITLPMRAVTGGRQPGEFVPEWIGEGAALPLGQNEDGTQRYVSSFGLPIEDESFKILGSLLNRDPQRALEQTMGASFPWLKFPLEFTFGKQLFSGRPIEDLKPYNWAGLGGTLNEKQARILTEIVSQTPASRFGSTASRMMDERKSSDDQLLSMLTGAKLTDVDAQRAYNAAITREIATQLLGEPGVRTHSNLYFPVDQIQNMSAENQKKAAIYQAYQERMRKLAEERKKAAR